MWGSSAGSQVEPLPLPQARKGNSAELSVSESPEA